MYQLSSQPSLVGPGAAPVPPPGPPPEEGGPPERRRAPAGIVLLLRLLSLLAAGVCGYLAWKAWSRGGPAGCGPGSDCDVVLASRWSTWFDVPVSVPALGVYLAIFAAALMASPRASPRRQRGAWAALAVLGVVAAGASAWFIDLQLRRIRHVCPYCMTAHACGLLIGVLVMIGLSRLTGRTRDASYRVAARTRPRRLWALFLLGLTGPAALIGGQMLSAPTYRFVIGAQSVELGPQDFPRLGSPDAPHVVALMGDYTCSHCRRMHAFLPAVRGRYGGQLAVVVLPVPMNSECNPAVRRTPPPHVFGCALAKLALAVWRADPPAFERFDGWLYEGESPPRPEAARARAEELIGKEALNRAEADPWVADALRRSVGLYASAGAGAIPKIVLPALVISGEVNSEKDLFRLIDAETGFAPSAGK